MIALSSYRVRTCVPLSDLLRHVLITPYALGELLVSKSGYFAKAFQDGFKDGREGLVELEDVIESTLEYFTAWLYTGRVFWQRDPQPPFPRHAQLQTDADDEDEDDFNDPAT